MLALCARKIGYHARDRGGARRARGSRGTGRFPEGSATQVPGAAPQNAADSGCLCCTTGRLWALVLAVITSCVAPDVADELQFHEESLDSRSAWLRGRPDAVYSRLSRAVIEKPAPWNAELDKLRIERRDKNRQLHLSFTTSRASLFARAMLHGRSVIHIGDNELLSHNRALRRRDVTVVESDNENNEPVWQTWFTQRDTEIQGTVRICVLPGTDQSSIVTVACSYTLSCYTKHSDDKGAVFEGVSWSQRFDNDQPLTMFERQAEIDFGSPMCWVQSSGLLERRILRLVAGPELREHLQRCDVELVEHELALLAESCVALTCLEAPAALEAARAKAEHQLDQWSQPIRYAYNRRTGLVTVTSLGPDGVAATADDIVCRSSL